VPCPVCVRRSGVPDDMVQVSEASPQQPSLAASTAIFFE
jgi:hypothetical protein